MKKAPAKKMIAPILIVVGGVLLAIPGSIAAFTIGALHPAAAFFAVATPLGVVGASVFVLIERLREITGGEEDDLGNY